jgi:CelD/BcsL family acetyltransferase involved in cellulose biosynthesis
VLDAEIITDLARLGELGPDWERLAIASKRPMSSPAWMLGWLQHLAPVTASARVVAIHEGGELVGVAPFFVTEKRRGRIDYRLLGNAFPRAAPLAVAGREPEVAAATCRALATASPRPDIVALENTSPPSLWDSLLRDGWPGRLRPVTRRYLIQASPVVSLLEESFEAWLGGKSSNFRSQMRRLRRQFTERGGVARTSTTQTLEADVELFRELHAGRWEGRGTSSIVAKGDRMGAMLNDVGRAHIESGRFRLWILELDGTPISAQLFAEAGGEVLYFNGGWDERFAKLKPAMLGILDAIEEAFARGDERIDLAPGAQPYKLRLADDDDPVTWTILMVPGPRLPLTAARSARMLAEVAARDAAKRGLSGASVDRLRRVKRALGA